MRAAAVAMAVLSAVHLGAQATGHDPLADATQVLLMPALGIVLWVGTAPPRARLVRLTLVALGLSWLGDTLPRFLADPADFLAMLGSFLAAQLVYSLAFWPYRSRSLLTRPVWMLPYLAVALAIIVLCAGAAGPLLPAVIAYAAAIVAMAVLATGIGPLAGLGAAVFVVSDALIALDTFGVLTLPRHGVWVMSTYLAAQLLLVLAVRSAVNQDVPSAGERRRRA